MFEESHLKRSIRNVSLDAHPIEQALVVKYQLDASLSSGDGTLAEKSKTYQKLINLKDLSKGVDVQSLASVVIQKCSIIPERSRPELEQILYYLQKRNGNLRTRSSLSHSENGTGSASSIKASMDKLDDYMELFYEELPEKTHGTACILELAQNSSNLSLLVENEALTGALVRIFREDWKKNFELATNIVRFFVQLSYYSQFQAVITQLKMGALSMQVLEHELKRGEVWKNEASKDEKGAKKYQLAIKKQHALMAACITLQTNIAEDLNVEQKIIKKDILPLLFKCLQFKQSPQLLLASVQFLLKLSVFVENKLVMDKENIVDRLIPLFGVQDDELRKYLIRLCFNLSFGNKNKEKMVSGGMVTNIASLIEKDPKALNLLYQLSINDDAKAMITYTDAIQLLMVDLLSGQASDVTKALLINAVVEKRNAQLVCGADGQGLDLLMEQALDNNDLLIAKIVRNIAAHTGPTQELFFKWKSRLVECMMRDASSSEEPLASLGLECAGTAALIQGSNWPNICASYSLVPWMSDILRRTGKEKEPLQLQIVIMCGTMAMQLDAARFLVPLLDSFLHLLHTMQEDDEFVAQLLYLFVQLLRHKELSDRLMGPQSALGAYVIDLMHDKNPAIREMCETALVIIGEHSVEWARRIASERFRWHNAQWMEMVEGGDNPDESDFFDVPALSDEWEGEVLFDDQLIEDDNEPERVF